MTTSQLVDMPEYLARRAAIERELQSTVITPISFEIYKKTPEEKLQMKLEKARWKEKVSNQYKY